MVSTSKSIALVLALAIAISSLTLSTIKPASAQTMPKPATPQFSIQVVDGSYDVPPSYYTDPYTGKQTTNPGYHVNDIRVEGKIKNQRFTSYTVPNLNSTGNNLDINFYYIIHYKGHFGTEWMQLYGTEDDDYPKQNYSSDYTNFNLSRSNAREFEDGAQIDVQIRAVIGFETWGFVATWPYRILNGEHSEWSNILTVTISKNATSPNSSATTIDSSPYPTLTLPETLPTPSSSPTVPELSWLAILPLLFSLISIAIIVRYRKTDSCSTV